jgi:hypothetical protein
LQSVQNTSTVGWFTVIEIAGKANTCYFHWCGENPKFTSYLCVWGEAGTVKIITNKTPKSANRGIPCVFVGYVLGHLGDTYRMWNPDTDGVHQTRDVIWRQQMYYKLVEKQASYITIKEDSHQATKNMTITAEEGNKSDESDPDEVEVGPVVQTQSGRTMRAPRQLIEEIGASMLSEPELCYYERLDEYGCISYGLVGAGISGGLHVMKFNEAMQTQDKSEWLKAVAEEHDCMKNMKCSSQSSKANCQRMPRFCQQPG